MSDRFVNLALFGLVVSLSTSGVLLFGANRIDHAWLYDLHRVTGLLLALFLIPKLRIIARSLFRQLSRHSWRSFRTINSLLLAGLVLATLALVFAWTLDLLPFYLHLFIWGTPLAFHWYLGFALGLPFALHSQRYFPRALKPSRLMTRREFLAGLALAGVALLSWRGLESVAARAGNARRFTGSRVQNSLGGNAFPVTSSDPVPTIRPEDWRLLLKGENRVELGYAAVMALAADEQVATLDCTLGWASTQEWHGVSIARLLERAGLPGAGHEVTVRSVTGAYTVLSLEEALGALLATHSGAEVLAPEHGFPARLVAPTRRGYHWIKWVAEIEVT